ncbi:TetR/AcrR family transcriptional regulator [Streptomyces sp. BI20]|uniref:TetR/AcrR family transcriptional regulator n=1 Tax=Streptomyces sp. BI20 TaxID=3403460 RepID=UPI003C70D4EA
MTGGERRVGRPRADRDWADTGRTPREELLDAAAELFTTLGYGATTTRAVAERAGMRQATMYHYFGGKESLFAELLEATVRPTAELARRLLAEHARPAERRLWELCRAEVVALCGGPHDLGALFLLPETRGERFGVFRRLRAELRSGYGGLLAEADRAVGRHGPGLMGGAGVAGEGERRELRLDLVVGLIEGVALAYRAPGRGERPIGEFAGATADAVLRVAGLGTVTVRD